MDFVNPNKTSVCYSTNIRIYAGFRLFEQAEIMRPAIAARNCYDTFTPAGNRKLRLYSMTFLLAGVILFLLVFTVLDSSLVTFSVFFGRSISHSVASISMLSVASFVSNTLFPGKLNFTDFISVFSTHTIIFQQFDSLTP